MVAERAFCIKMRYGGGWMPSLAIGCFQPIEGCIWVRNLQSDRVGRNGLANIKGRRKISLKGRNRVGVDCEREEGQGIIG